MGILAWLIVGLIAGFIGSKVVNRSGEGLVRDIILGIVGAFVGGIIFQALGYSGVTGVNLYSIAIAAVGAIVVLALFHAIRGQRASAS
ncbi:MAG TPA: GlsB/YeaQ/YmgE family stress response membrane protein [Candidatus Binataceae bacterium]